MGGLRQIDADRGWRRQPGAAGQSGARGAAAASGTCVGGGGGHGGAGAASGGGAGGLSVGVLWKGVNAPQLDNATQNAIEIGTAGGKGPGGAPGINDGIAGIAEKVHPL